MVGEGPVLRVLVWNVHGFRAGVQVVARAIAAQEPDIVLLNETRFRRRVRALARRLGMGHVTALGWPRPVTNSLLAKPPWRIAASRRIVLPRVRKLKRRGILIARLQLQDLPVTAAVVHLGVSDPERIVHARIVTDEVGAEAGPLMLGGDLNEGPDRPAVRWIAARYRDSFAAVGEGEGKTFPSASPRARIDYLFVSEGLAVRSASVITDHDTAVASDHLPAVADLEMTGA